MEDLYKWPRDVRVGDRVRVIYDVSETIKMGLCGTVVRVYHDMWPDVKWDDGQETQITAYDSEPIGWT